MKLIVSEEKEKEMKVGILPEIEKGIGKGIPVGETTTGIEIAEVIEMTDTDVTMMISMEGEITEIVEIIEILHPSTSNRMNQNYMAYTRGKSPIFWTSVAS
jgi:hypothetical protein